MSTTDKASLMSSSSLSNGSMNSHNASSTTTPSASSMLDSSRLESIRIMEKQKQALLSAKQRQEEEELRRQEQEAFTKLELAKQAKEKLDAEKAAAEQARLKAEEEMRQAALEKQKLALQRFEEEKNLKLEKLKPIPKIPLTLKDLAQRIQSSSTTSLQDEAAVVSTSTQIMATVPVETVSIEQLTDEQNRAKASKSVFVSKDQTKIRYTAAKAVHASSLTPPAPQTDNADDLSDDDKPLLASKNTPVNRFSLPHVPSVASPIEEALALHSVEATGAASTTSLAHTNSEHVSHGSQGLPPKPPRLAPLLDATNSKLPPSPPLKSPRTHSLIQQSRAAELELEKKIKEDELRVRLAAEKAVEQLALQQKEVEERKAKEHLAAQQEMRVAAPTPPALATANASSLPTPGPSRSPSMSKLVSTTKARPESAGTLAAQVQAEQSIQNALTRAKTLRARTALNLDQLREDIDKIMFQEEQASRVAAGLERAPVFSPGEPIFADLEEETEAFVPTSHDSQLNIIIEPYHSKRPWWKFWKRASPGTNSISKELTSLPEKKKTSRAHKRRSMF